MLVAIRKAPSRSPDHPRWTTVKGARLMKTFNNEEMVRYKRDGKVYNIRDICIVGVGDGNKSKQVYKLFAVRHKASPLWVDGSQIERLTK